MPTKDEIRRLFELKLTTFDNSFETSTDLVERAKVLSPAEIIRVCDDAIKSAILSNSEISQKQLMLLVDERIAAYSSKEA